MPKAVSREGYRLALAIAGREPVRPARAVRAGLPGFGWATVAYAYHRRRHAAPVGQAATRSGSEARTAVAMSVATSPNVASVSVESSTNGRSH